jgi:hypothetical protein
MAVPFKSLVEKHQFTEQKVFDILKVAQIVDAKDTIDKVRARQFSDEIIENGFNVIVDYVSTGLIQDGDWQKASELFKGHQSQQEKIAKQAAVDSKSKGQKQMGRELAAQEASQKVAQIVVPGEFNLHASAEAAQKLPPDIRTALESLVSKKTKEFVSKMPNATAAQIKSFQDELWHNISLAINFLAYESTLHHMSQPEFAEAMEAAFDA